MYRGVESLCGFPASRGLSRRYKSERNKLIEFQFNLLHRRIPTTDFLLKIGRKENDNCTFWNNSSETLIHLFWSCYILFLEKRNWLASKRSSVNRQIQLIEHRILVSVKLLEAFSIRQTANRSLQLRVCSFALPRFQILARRSVQFRSFLFSQNIIQYKNANRNCKVAREPRRNQNEIRRVIH